MNEYNLIIMRYGRWMNRMNTRIMSNLEECICQMSKMSIQFDVKQIAYVKLITK